MTVRITAILLCVCVFFCCEDPNETMMPGSQQASFTTNQKIPTLYIDVDEEIPIGEEISMSLIVDDGSDALLGIDGKIERRGGFSIGFDKHSYKLDLVGEHSLAGLVEDDDWILNANYIDKTFLRHRFSYELFSDMSIDHMAPACAYANVKLNGEYNGFYLLTERLDKSSLAIDDLSQAAFIFKEPPVFIEEQINPQNPGNYYQQTYPDIDEDDRTETLDELKEFLFTSTEEDFNQEIKLRFDISNIVDWHLLLLLSNNNDGVLKNFYLYKKDDQTPFRISPWDYDHSFGRDGDNELNMLDRVVNPERSILFERLMSLNWYRDFLKNRWAELNEEGLFSLEHLKERVTVYKDLIDPHTEANFDKWSVNSQWYYDDNGYEQEVDIFIQFLELRHPNLDEYINQL